MNHVIKRFILHTTTNNGDKSKQYYTVVVSEENQNALVIRKLVLAKDIFYGKTHKMIKQYKDYYLFEQVISIKLETLSLIIKELNDLFNN